MPLYNFSCTQCEAPGVTLFRKIVDRDAPAICDVCEGWLERRISAPVVLSDYEGYRSPVTGEWVQGRAAHKEDLAKHGCRIYEPGETLAAQRRHAERNAAFEDRIADAAAKQVMAMPSEKRAQLAQALETHDVSYARAKL